MRLAATPHRDLIGRAHHNLVDGLPPCRRQRKPLAEIELTPTTPPDKSQNLVPELGRVFPLASKAATSEPTSSLSLSGQIEQRD